MRHPTVEQSVLFGDKEKLVLCLKGFDRPGQLAGSHRGCAGPAILGHLLLASWGRSRHPRLAQPLR